jgi:membrane protease YdiL (CAAX protease family)
LRDTIRPIAFAIVFATLGFTLRAALKLLLDVELAKWIASLANFTLAAFGAFVVFPRWLKQPFGEVGLAEYSHRLGFYLPAGAWKHVLLGIVLALCTLSGMWVGSLLGGGYAPDRSNVTLSHVLFCLNPGVWEEFFYRGIVMIVLLKCTRSIRQAALVQILIFGLLHVKGVDLWSWLDAVSVMIIAVAFTYAAYKTRVLLSGIVFHFLHDVFLLVAQSPGGEAAGFAQQGLFYLALWVMVGVACIAIKVAADKLGVQAQDELYRSAAARESR